MLNGKPISEEIMLIDFPAYNDRVKQHKLFQDQIVRFLSLVVLIFDVTTVNTKDGANQMIKNLKRAYPEINFVVFVTHLDILMRHEAGPDGANPQRRKTRSKPVLTATDSSRIRLQRKFESLKWEICRDLPDCQDCIFPAVLQISGDAGFDLLESSKLISKFDSEEWAPFASEMEEQFVVYGYRGIKRVIWEKCRNWMSQSDLAESWKKILNVGESF